MAAAVRRRAIVLVSVDLVIGLGTGRCCKVTKGLPAGYRVISTAFLPDRMCFGVCVEHESLKPIPEGEILPYMDGPQMEAI